MSDGKIIVIDGACDGVGKSEQLKLLTKKLINANYKVVTHHFPTKDKPQGILPIKYLNGDFGSRDENDPLFVNALFAIDRSVTWNEELREKYNNGSIILLDRYTTSSLIYQGAEYKTEEEKISFISNVTKLEYENLKIGIPDIVIFLYAPYDVIKMLRIKRNSKKDIFEEDEEYLKKVWENSLFVAKYLNWDIIDCMDKNRLKSIEEINDEIATVLEQKLQLKINRTLK